MKKILVLGGGGFIGGHLAKKLKSEGNFVRVVDIKIHEHFYGDDFCDEFIQGDLRNPLIVSQVMFAPGQSSLDDKENSFDEVYQLAADMGGAGYIFTGEWEKLFSERLYLAFNRNYNLDVRIGRFHNIFGPQGTWYGGKEKAPAAMCRKVAETPEGGEIDVWGDGQQTRSFLYIDECLEAIEKLMSSNFLGPVNIGSEEMVTINELAQMAIDISGKNITIKNIDGEEFREKYGFKCPVGVRGRNSDNNLYFEKIGWKVNQPLYDGIEKTYLWINNLVNN